MPLFINTNVASINSQRQLVKSGADMDQAMERLSSGKRINSAADDAAGLAISNRLTSQVRGLDRAVSNANDGISLIQTAEGALDETTNILQRMRELSIQSSNGIFTDADRTTLDAEIKQLVAELDRISETTTFNGQTLLDGSLGDVSLQVGAEANETITFSIAGTSADSLGLNSQSSVDLTGARLADGAGAITFNDGDIQINGQDLLGYTSTANHENIQDLLDNINDGISGVSAELINSVEATTTGTGTLVATAAAITLTVHAVDGGGDQVFTIANETTDTLEELATLISDTTGNAISASVNDDGKLVLASANGAAITTAELGTVGGIADDTYGSFLALSSDTGGAVTITRGAAGTEADIASLGYRDVTGAGQVEGAALTSSAGGAQLAALGAGDLEINGVKIAAVSADAGLGAKIDAINASSDDTGVTASAEASAAFAADVTQQFVQLGTTGSTAGLANSAAADVNVQINGFTVAMSAGAGASDIAANINTTTTAHGVTAYLDDNDILHLYSLGPVTITSTGSAGELSQLLDFHLDDGAGGAGLTTTGATVFAAAPSSTAGSVEINGTEVSLTDISVLATIVTDLNAAQGSTGVSARVDENGELELTSNSAFTIKAGDTNSLASIDVLGISTEAGLAVGAFMDTSSGADTNLSNESFAVNPHIVLDSANDQAISIDVTADGATATGLLDQNTDLSAGVGGSSLSTISIATQAGAQEAINSIDNALETINGTRSELGAVNNRLDFTISNLMNISEKTVGARSRIEDADFAMETASLSRAQVLQQAASAMLAQANAQPQQVLSLLN